MTEAEALSMYRLLKDKISNLSYLDRNSSSFQRGLVVTTFYLAKGLEFDQVFAITKNEDSAFLRQTRYICATRALHELYMYQYVTI